MTTLDSLTVDIDVNSQLGQLKNPLKEMSVSFGKIAAAATVANTAVALFTNSMAKANLADIKIADSLGIATNDFLNLGNAISLMGDDSNQVGVVLNSLTKNLAQFKDVGTGLNIGAFARFGIDVKDANGELKSAEDLLFSVSDAIKNIDDVGLQRRVLSETLGDDSLLFSLKQGSDIIKENIALSEQLGDVQSDATRNVTLELNKQKNILGRLIGSIKGGVADETIAIFAKGLETVNTVIKDNKEEIEEFLSTLFTNVNKVFNFMLNIGGRVVSLFNNIVATFGGLGNVGKIAIGIFAALQIKLLKSVALATGLFLVVEDIFKGLQGQDSLTGDFLGTDNIQAVTGALDKLNISVGQVAAGIAGLVLFRKPLLGLIKTLGSVGKVAGVVSVGGKLLGKIVPAIAIAQGVYSAGKAGYDTVKQGGGIGDFLKRTANNFVGADLFDVGSKNTNSSTVNNNNNANITVNVSTPEEASQFIQTHNRTDTIGSV